MSQAPPERTVHPLARTADLLQAHRAGDPKALQILLVRFRPLLQRWAHGRLPARARHGLDTEDVVQESMVRALNHLEHFESRHESAFMGYLRTICTNLIRDRIRATNRRPEVVALDNELASGDRSPIEELIGREKFERYERALAALPPAYGEALILRLEYGLSYEEIAGMMERPTSEAARKLVERAHVRLIALMAADHA